MSLRATVKRCWNKRGNLLRIFVFLGLTRGSSFTSEALTAGSHIRFGMIILLVLGLTGCSVGYESQSLEDYFLNKNSTQEQKNSSKINILKVPPSSSLLNQEGGTESTWRAENYPTDCEWLPLMRVVDGDTIIVGDNVRVRMIGIDTPESKRQDTPIQPYALDASAALQEDLKNQSEVCLIFDEVGDQYDTYDRRLSYVFTREGADLNAQMIRDGWAKAYTRFPMERADEFTTLEVQARAAKVGRWE